MANRRKDSDSSNFQDKIKMHNAAVNKRNSDKMDDDGPGRIRRKNRGKK
jgi:hypothetical protein